MTYRILAENMERLEKKLARIGNKCKKYGNDFTYKVVDEEYGEVTDENGDTSIHKFFIIEAEGKAIINDWKFIASIEHTEKGNIFHKTEDVEIPQKYYGCNPCCEHCNNKRTRKDTYIVQNTVTGEFKQVGRSCLADFTSGMSAEGIAAYISMFDELIQGEAPLPGRNYTSYIGTEEALKCIAETIRHFGFVKSDSDDGWPTKARARRYYDFEQGNTRYMTREEKARIQRELNSIGFDANSAQASELVHNALEWLHTQDETKDGNYLHNLRTACSLEYVDYAHFGLLASLFPSYNKHLIVEQKKREQREAEEQSKHVGAVGERIELTIKDFTVITSWVSQFGTVGVYLIHDTLGNVFTWKTANYIPENAVKLVGTVKEHKEYNGIKQTELTRCKVIREKFKLEDASEVSMNTTETLMPEEFER